MRAGIQLIFVLLYLVSGLDTLQSRLDYIVSELLHSSSRSGNPALDNACKVRLHYTHFREAKKIGTEHDVSGRETKELFRPASSRHFMPQDDSAAVAIAAEISAARAPPILL